MKFDFAIGNPPYNVEAPGDSTSEKPVYHSFMNEAFKVAERIELITPARFLFNAGATPKEWNSQMLNDSHFKVLQYEANAEKVFPSTAITGGIAITYYNNNGKYQPIEVFIPFPELTSIRQKVVNVKGYVSLSEIISGRTPYLFTNAMHIDNPDAVSLLSKGHENDISSNVFSSLDKVFVRNDPNNEDEYLRVLGRLGNERTYCWIKRKYAKERGSSIGKWKVFLPKANGASGMLGEEAARMISRPVVGSPSDIATDTFICVGPFDCKHDADAALKYLLSKFARVLLGTLKVTQINSRETWRNVPLVDFSKGSDIDWSVSISQIDKQLYRKYGLNEDEIRFIENHVKEME